MKRSFRQALLERRVTLGTWLQINNATAAEVLSNAGYDWIAVDIEHTDIDDASLVALLRGMYGRGAAPLARVTHNDVMAIRRALDMGAEGVLVPFVSTAAEARQVVAAAKYPPLGVRGFSFCRANNWGVDFQADARTANAETAVLVMIESRAGVENIEAILQIEGLDGAFIGPYDLSGSYGIPGQTQEPVVQDACRKVVRACEQAGKAAGLLVAQPTPETVEQAVNDGFTVIGLGTDTVFLDQAARAARELALSALGAK
jgi:2-keto-3-deoxy-L-rhamnonate aldolase RhmA